MSFLKKILPIVLLILSITAFSQSVDQQKEDKLSFYKGAFLPGGGLGTKCVWGNLGFTFNYFFLKNLSVDLSAGFGQANFNGLLVSGGPEFNIPLSKNIALLLGSVYTISGAHSESVENRGSPNPSDFSVSGGQYIRSFTGIAINVTYGVLKIELGYSYAVREPSYQLKVGPFSQKFVDNLEKGIRSGILIGISYQKVFLPGN
jgi:hypothetical protein